MNELTNIRIRHYKHPGKGWLSLNGTILTLHNRTWGCETIIDIPVELISVREKKAFNVSRLIWALLSLLLFPLLGIVVYILDIFGIMKSPMAQGCFLILVNSGIFILFLVQLVRFLIRQRIISLVVEPRQSVIEFWFEARDQKVLDRLLSEIKARQQLVEQTIANPLQFALGNVSAQPWKRTAYLMFLFSLPALIVDNPWLLLAGLIPLLWHFINIILSSKTPPLFKEARHFSLKGQWAAVRERLERLISETPSYFPAKLLLIDALLHLGKFEEAGILLNSIESQIDADRLQQIQLEMIHRQRIYDRKGIVQADALNARNKND